MSDQEGFPPPPPLPDVFTFPTAVVNEWISRGPDDPVLPSLVRHDWDQLYSAFDKALSSQTAFQTCITAWSNNEIPKANAWLNESRRLVAESQSAWRRFFMAVMTSSRVAPDE